MRVLLLIAAVFTFIQAEAQSIKDRVKPNDAEKYRELKAVHAGAGSMGFTELIGRNDLASNFLYLHAGKIHPKSGIGHHFHHSIEEMFVILDGEAEFTVNGRTSTIKAPAIVPCKMGDSHAIYNHTDEPLTWLNFAVSTIKARGDAYDLNDTREGAVKDDIPVFVSSRLETEKLRSNTPEYEESDINFRRILGPEVFSSDWHHVDHLQVAAGSSSNPRKMEGFEEVYYVVKGNGKVNINGQDADISTHEAFYTSLGEEIAISNNGNEDLELLVIGIYPSKGKKNQKANQREAMVLQMDFVVEKDKSEEFEKMYHSIYVPAMTVQQGYLESKLLKLYPDPLAEEIEAEETTYNYQIQISFDTEENRRKWVASKQHDIAWPAATDLAKEFKWRGYDVKGEDGMP